MKKIRKKGRYSLSEAVIQQLEKLREYEESYRNKGFFTHKVDVVTRIFFEKDEYEWVKTNDNASGWFVSSKYHRYYNLNSQKGIKAFNKLNEEEQEFYFDRCRKTIKKVYESRNSYSFLHFYENIENIYVVEEKKKAKDYYDKYIKPDIQKEIKDLKRYENDLSRDLKKHYQINFFPSIVNTHLFEINQSKDEPRFNLYTKTGINRFRKLSKEEKMDYICKIKQKLEKFYISNKKYHSRSTSYKRKHVIEKEPARSNSFQKSGSI